jgi:nucleotide-binding universal stress UspA family protein
MMTVSAAPRISLRNIAVATDFSACSESALQQAQRLARRYGSMLYCINVLPHLPFVESAEPDPEQFRRTAQKKMAEMAGSASFQGIKHTELIREGEVAQAFSSL